MPLVWRACGARWLTVPCTRRAHFSYPLLIFLPTPFLHRCDLERWCSFRGRISCRVFLWSISFSFSFSLRSRLPCFRLRFRFHGRRINGRCSENAAPFERFRPGKSPVGEFFIKICLPRGRGEKELVWLRDPCKICHLNVCNVLRMHRDFLGNFFPPATRGVFPVNSSEVLRRFVNSCGNIANASNGDGAKGGKWGREGESW